MSIEAIKWAFDFDAKNSSEKAVLLALANYAGGDGRCHPGQESIAKKASCSDRTVRTVLADLEERGVLARERRTRKDGSRTSDTIVILPLSSQPENPSGSGEANRKYASSQPENPSGSGEANRKYASSQPENPSGLTTFEPPVEPSAAAAREKCDLESLTEKLVDAVGEDKIHSHGRFDLSAILGLMAANVDLETDILPTIRARALRLARPVRGWSYFTDAIRDAYNRRIEAGQGLSQPKVSSFKRQEDMSDDERRIRWGKVLNYARGTGIWRTWLDGPPPGQAGCRVPGDMLEARDTAKDWIEERKADAA